MTSLTTKTLLLLLLITAEAAVFKPPGNERHLLPTHIQKNRCYMVTGEIHVAILLVKLCHWRWFSKHCEGEITQKINRKGMQKNLNSCISLYCSDPRQQTTI